MASTAGGPHARRQSDATDRLLLAAAVAVGVAALLPLAFGGAGAWLLWVASPRALRPPRIAAALVGALCLTGAAWVFRVEGMPLGDVAQVGDWLTDRYTRPALVALDALLPIGAHWLTANGGVWHEAGVEKLLSDSVFPPPLAVLLGYVAGVWPFGLVGAGVVGVGVAAGVLSASSTDAGPANPPQPTDAPYRPKAERADREARRTGGGTQWLIHGIIGRQCLTIISGPYKGGKSTLVCALLRALLTGEDVLGLAATKARRVRWFTEESPGSMRQKLRQWELSDKRLTIIYRGQSGAVSWAAVLAFLERDCRDGEVVVVDTLAVHVSNQPGAENSTDVMTAAMEAARGVAQRKGVAVVFVHHDNAGGKMRGAVAIGASVDVIGHVRLPEGTPYERDETVRHWTAESRVDETPRSLFLQLCRPENEPPSYLVLPDPEAEKPVKRRHSPVASSTKRNLPEPEAEKAGNSITASIPIPEPDSVCTPTGRAADILRVLSEAPTPCGAPELAAVLGVHRASLHGVLKTLVADGLVSKQGAGGRADPVRYMVNKETAL